MSDDLEKEFIRHAEGAEIQGRLKEALHTEATLRQAKSM